MKYIIKFVAVITTVFAPSIAAAHVGSIVHDAYLHGAAHGLEIFTALLIVYLGYRCWRKNFTDKLICSEIVTSGPTTR